MPKTVAKVRSYHPDNLDVHSERCVVPAGSADARDADVTQSCVEKNSAGGSIAAEFLHAFHTTFVGKNNPGVALDSGAADGSYDEPGFGGKLNSQLF